MRRFFSYLRVSTPQQGVSGLGLEAQRDAVAQYVSRHGTLLAEYVEVETGKRHKNRPQLLAALDHCKRMRATLVIAKLDRLSRNAAFISQLLESDVQFVCCDNPHATKTMLRILAVFAQHEGEQISERTIAALAAAKARGIKLGNPRYQEALICARAALRYRDVPPEVEALIVQWRDVNGSLQSIADRLNRLNIRTPQGCRWYASTVRAVLLKNEGAKPLNDAMTNARYDDVALAPDNERAKARNNESAPTSLLPVNAIPATPVFSPNAGRGLKTGGTPMPSDITAALKMWDLFTSVGARECVLTRYDIEKNVKWGKHYLTSGLRETLPTTMRLADKRYSYTLTTGETIMTGDNLAIRPIGKDVQFFQLDDLTHDRLSRLQSATFLMHETSPGNYQAWIAVSGLPDDKEEVKAFMRRIRKAVGGNDKSASGATRLAGTSNFKPQYAPNFPIITITHTAPGRVLTEDELLRTGLLAAPEPMKTPPAFMPVVSSTRPWPSYEICLQRAPKKDDGSPDRSKADINFCLTAITGGHSAEETAQKLLEVSMRAQSRSPSYARDTAATAAFFVAQNYGKSRGRA